MRKTRTRLAGIAIALATSSLFALELPPQNSPATDPQQTADAPAEHEDAAATAAETPDVVPDFEASAKPAAAMPLAPTPESLRKRIRDGLAMPEIDSPLVARHEAWFLNHPDYFQRMIERSRLYLFFIVEEVEKRNMPLEIALLPMIESGYNSAPIRALMRWASGSSSLPPAGVTACSRLGGTTGAAT
jgi:membrane-bound lytic murein transglycosylase D